MHALSVRQSERVECDADVELSTHDELSTGPLRVQGRALNLSDGGMMVRARTELRVGDEVICRLRVDGREADLPGHVAWARASEDAGHEPGLGVRFGELSETALSLLRETMETAVRGTRQVEVQVPGIEAPLQARARMSGDGMRMWAAVPMLSRDAELSFRLERDGPLFTGRVREARLRERAGERRLEVEVEVVDQESTRFRKQTRYGYAPELEATPALVMRQRSRQPAPTEPTRGRGLPRIRLGWSLTGAAVAGGLLTFATVSSIWSDRADFAIAGRFSPAAAVTQPAGGSTIEVEPLGDATRLLVPLEGTLEDADTRIDPSPLSLVLDLPDATTSLAVGRHAVDSGPVRELAVKTSAPGTVLRVALAAEIAGYQLRHGKDGLEITVTH